MRTSTGGEKASSTSSTATPTQRHAAASPSSHRNRSHRFNDRFLRSHDFTCPSSASSSCPLKTTVDCSGTRQQADTQKHESLQHISTGGTDTDHQEHIKPEQKASEKLGSVQNHLQVSPVPLPGGPRSQKLKKNPKNHILPLPLTHTGFKMREKASWMGCMCDPPGTSSG